MVNNLCQMQSHVVGAATGIGVHVQVAAQNTQPLPPVLSRQAPPAHPPPSGGNANEAHDVPGKVEQYPQAFASVVYTPSAIARKQNPAALNVLESRDDLSRMIFSRQTGDVFLLAQH